MSRLMKHSGIEWIGDIPENWGIDTIGTLYVQRMEKVSDKDFQPLSVGKMGVVPQLENAAKTDNGDDRKLVRIGDFAINSRSDRRGSCGISQYDGSVSLINTILTPKTEMNPIYYNWLFHTSLFADEFYKWGHGIVDDLWTTRWQEMKRISIVIPPLSEQQIIADFLDKKCGEIDELVSLQEKMIEELKNYKQSVITEAVTKGLNPNAPMKDSGVRWIGNTPENWEVCRLKYYVSVKSGDGIDGQEFKADAPYPVYGGGELIGYCERFNVDETNILIGRVGARCGCVTKLNGKSWATDNALVLTTTLLRDYCCYLLIGCNLNDLNTSNAQPLITSTKVRNISFPLPPVKEQQEIADYLDKKCSEIDDLISIKQKKMDELKEYKKSLIYEYVTGKKQVV